MDVRAYVKAKLEKTATVPTVDAVVEDVLANTTDEQKLAMLPEALACLVKDVIKSTHVQMPFFPVPAEAPAPAKVGKKKLPFHNPSWHVRQVQDTWATSTLNQIYATDSGRKKLAFCTVEDVTFIANGMFKQAENFTARATTMQRLAEEMVAQNVKVVKDLDLKLLRSALDAENAA